ncbi:MAG: hypothetical protein EPO13_02830 [Actinomycetota bacterium]|nr:MAG: hypothetical protein EPO13_02830 [Actinomycetota bacterium]
MSNYTTPNVDGHLTVKATVRHSGTTAATGNLTIFVYVGGNLVATTRAQLTSPVPASGTPVTFTSTDRWVPGSKVLVLATG